MSQDKIKKRALKSAKHHFDNIERLKEGEPTKEELKEMYGYLDTCWACGKPLRFLEPFLHSFAGNAHKFGCNIFGRIFGWIFNFVFILFIKLPLLLVLLFIIAPFYYGGEFLKKLRK